MRAFERFSDDIRAAMRLANREAAWRLHERIDVPHLLIALAREPTGLAGALLRLQGADARRLRSVVNRHLARGSALRIFIKLPLTSQVDAVIENAIVYAQTHKHDAVGTGGVLLAMLVIDPRVAAFLQAISVDTLRLERLLTRGLHQLMVVAPTEPLDLASICSSE